MTGNLKPYTDKKGQQGEADRVAAPQPLKFGTHYNLRKLMELPIHLVRAKMDEIKTHVLCNVEWLMAKFSATSFR